YSPIPPSCGAGGSNRRLFSADIILSLARFPVCCYAVPNYHAHIFFLHTFDFKYFFTYGLFSAQRPT
ncbi:hypothetical protein, partial [Trichlorobacter lovleyi]|uniref:hypothetical protein n=1 Tax=Trichlorobacter lovleyi TaxID=313985 RepID=UPI002480264C